ncbi:MAG TPA: hypothetical protein DEG92_04150, partial [Rikenellaceae bacterium]|nr:hypothetical protein [Rikenellaceae bacterium]
QILLKRQNKLLSATNKATSAKKEYFYDAESRLIKERVISSGSEKSYLYNGSQIVEERNNAGALLNWNIHGLGIDDLLRTTKAGIKYYPLTNEQNSVLALTDIAGNVLQRYDYSAFGKLIVQDADGVIPPQPGIPLVSTLFQGRELDLETGLYNFRARWYSPELGRFISHDPIGYADGMNMYEGFRGNPVRYTDPMGTIAGVDDALILGAIAGAAAILSDDEARERGSELLSDVADWVQGSCENIGKKIGEAVYGAAEQQVNQETSKPSEEQHQKEQKQQSENIKNTNEGTGGVTTPPPPPNPEEGQEKDSKTEKNKTSSEEITKQTEKEADGKKGQAKQDNKSVQTPQGIAHQETSQEAKELYNEVKNGKQIYRSGNFPRSKATEGQYWSTDNPLNHGYADRVGAANLNNETPDFVIGGTIKEEANFVTRKAPPYGTNQGGALEIVTDENEVKINFFHMPD